MDIESFIDFKPYIERNKLIFLFTSNGIEITELRMLCFMKKMENAIKDIYNETIQKVYFVFDIEQLKIPTNFSFVKDFAKMMNSHESILSQKLEFTIVQTPNNIFRLFFNVFQKYYVPLKPLYLCKTSEESFSCLHEESERCNFPNILNMLKEKNN